MKKLKNFSQNGKKNYKYTKYKELQSNSKKNLPSETELQRLHAPCECGSGLDFEVCCYRPGHRRFDLFHYLDKLKNTKLNFGNQILRKFVNQYQKDPILKKISDEISTDIGSPTFQAILQNIQNNPDIPMEGDDPIHSAVHMESVTLDQILPNHTNTLYYEYIDPDRRKFSTIEQEFFDSYSIRAYPKTSVA